MLSALYHLTLPKTFDDATEKLIEIFDFVNSRAMTSLPRIKPAGGVTPLRFIIGSYRAGRFVFVLVDCR